MANDKAVVTIVIGKRYFKRWKWLCQTSWQQYVNRHQYDLVVIDAPLDTSERAANRSPAWQKCLILGDDRVRRYKQVAWVDSDILINPTSPAIFEHVPETDVGAVEWSAALSRSEYEIVLDRQQAYWSMPSLERSAQEFYTRFGLPSGLDEVVQTGVLVLSPRFHRDLLEAVYNEYEDKGSSQWHYEMRPLSYELLKANCIQWIDHRFNANWFNIKCMHYPFLLRQSELDYRLISRLHRKLEQMLAVSLHYRVKRLCATATFHNNYFLHFAGSALDMQSVNL